MKFEVLVACGVAVSGLSSAVAAQSTSTPSPVASTSAVTPAAPAAVSPPVVAQPLPQIGPGSALPSNTDVWVSLDQKLDSHEVKVGDPLSFKVSRDVMLGNYVVIPRGTPAAGRVSLRSGRGAFGKSAKLEFDVENITLGGHAIPVSGHFLVKGDGNTGATIGAVAAAGLVGGLFVKGRSATAAEGSEWKVATREPVAVTVGAGQ